MTIHQEQARIDYLFSVIGKIEDDELKAHWSRYLCVLVSGFIESSMRTLLDDFAKRNASPRIYNYVSNMIQDITNLKSANIADLLAFFDVQWYHKYIDLVPDAQKDSLNSVVANRHQIAHGRNVGITYVTIKNYYANTKQAIVSIQDIVSGRV